MTCRKWAVRGVVFAVVGALVALALVYQHWTSPATVRRLVLDKLAAKFPGAIVAVESTHLRLLGGIQVRELRMIRRDDADNTTFLYVPSAIIYHDKEQLLEGRLVLRKIELERPRLRVWRERDGRLSLTSLIKPDPDERIPSLVFRNATLVIEDRLASPGSPLIEIKNVSFRLVNDPQPLVTFDGSGSSDLGPLGVKGHWKREEAAARISVTAPGIPVNAALMTRIQGLCPEAVEHLRDLSAMGNLEADLTWQEGRSPAWQYGVSLSLAQGRFRHRDLPLALENLTAMIRCVDGQIPRVEVKAYSNGMALTFTARNVALPIPCEDGTCPTPQLPEDLDLTIDNLVVSETLFDVPFLKPFKKEIYDRFQPSGPTSVTLQLRPVGRGPWRRRLFIEPRGMTGTYEKFIYTLERITGTVEYQTSGPGTDVWEVDLTGHSAERPIRIKGQIRGEPPLHTVDLNIWGESLPLDAKIQFALDELSKSSSVNFGKLARSFKPTGLADFHVHAHHPPGSKQYQNRFVIRFHEATVKYEEFPYLFRDVSGILEVRPNQSWEFREFRGRHGDTWFTTSGGSKGPADGVRIRINGRNVRFDADLREALKPELHSAWAQFNPQGGFDCEGSIQIPPSPPGESSRPTIDLTLLPRGCTVAMEAFRYVLSDLNGTIHYANNALLLHGLTARHGNTGVRIDKGVVLLKPNGGFTADLTYLHAERLRFDEDLLRALRGVHDGLGRACAVLDLQGSLELHTRLYVDAAGRESKPRVYWDGSVVLRDASLRTGVRLEHVTGTVAARGWFNGTRLDGVDGNLDLSELTVFGQPLTHLRGELLVTEAEPDVLRFPGLMATYLGGQVYGPARVEFGSRLRYELSLTGSQIRLEEFGRHNFRDQIDPPDLQGLALARVSLRGEGSELANLRGSGRLDVPNGKIERLPPLVDLLKFLGLRLPDRTAFEEAHATFDIEGPRARVRHLDLVGNAISLRGQGDMNLDGSDLNLDFNVDWARLGQMLPAGVREIPREISNQLLKIEARGRLGDLRFHKQPVPILTDPLRRMLGGEGRND